MKKSILILLSIAIIVLAVGGWYVFSNSETSKAAKIAQIASSTETQMEIGQRLQHDFEQWGVTQATNSTKRIDIVGVSFDSPWGEPKSIDNRGSVAQLDFPNGERVGVWKPTATTSKMNDFLADTSDEMPAGSPRPDEVFKRVLGEGFSEYELLKYALDTKIADIRNATTVESAQARSYALIVRHATAHPGKPYEFSTNNLKGFIYEKPDNFFVQTWHRNSNYRNTITLTGSDDGSVSKEDVNTIISSMKFTKTQTGQASGSDNYFAD